jgi:hypothetical protein
MLLRNLIYVLFTLVSFAANAEDLSEIRKLPARLAELKKEGHKKWDTGVTIDMLEGTDGFNKGLIRILKDLLRIHAAKGHIREADVDQYVKTLVSKLDFEQKLGNPRGEDRGTLALLEVPSGLSDELQRAIVILVRGIIGDAPSFDFDQWHVDWEKSSKMYD